MLLVLFLGLILSACTSSPDTAKSFKTIFDHYRQKDGVSAISFPPSLVGIFLSDENPEQAEMKKLMQELSAFRMLVVEENAEGEGIIDDLSRHVSDMTSRQAYEDLFRMQSGEEDIFIRIRESEGIVNDAIMMVSSDDSFFAMELKGNIQLSHLTRLMESGYLEDLTSLADIDF